MKAQERIYAARRGQHQRPRHRPLRSQPAPMAAWASCHTFLKDCCALLGWTTAHPPPNHPPHTSCRPIPQMPQCDGNTQQLAKYTSLTRYSCSNHAFVYIIACTKSVLTLHTHAQRNVVSNINTGEMFLLPTGSDGLVHELSSGRSISFDEFEAKIGLHPQEVRPCIEYALALLSVECS